MPEPLFRRPDEKEAALLTQMTARGIAGAEIHTFLKLNAGAVPEGTLFAAVKDGAPVGAALNTGDYTVTLLPGTPPYEEGLFLLKSAGVPDRGGEKPVRLTLSDLLEAKTLLAGGTLSRDDELRYVYRARCMREGLRDQRRRRGAAELCLHRRRKRGLRPARRRFHRAKSAEEGPCRGVRRRAG